MSDQEKDKLLQQLKDALVAIRKLKGDLNSEREKNSGAIAIVGMSMRFPGNVNNAEDYWKLLSEGVDAITDIPEDRFSVSELYNEQPGTRGKISVKQGGFISDIDKFDGSFFDITPVEIESMDPQQRVLLELTVEAIENAGMDLNKMVGSNTGVYMGVSSADYQVNHFRSGDYNLVGPYAYTGSAYSAVAGRISYMMGLEGPCLTLDTACSSSIIAAHLGVRALRSGECDQAVIGGVNLMLEPEMTICFSNLNALSPDARCKTFDNSANGYVRSEGCGILVLKRLSDAQRDGDNVLAVIKGSAINQDGRSNGFTAPNVKAQADLIHKALADANLKPEDIGYVEAHGTGTKIGDPIEIEALTNVFQAHKSKTDPLYVGSVKSNVGHLEGAAGMASMIKAVLALQHDRIPQSIHFKKPNELVNWKAIPIEVPTRLTDFKGSGQFIGTSGFGITGTNGHLILGKAPATDKVESEMLNPADRLLLPLSARSPEALSTLAGSYISFLSDTDISASNICSFNALKRAHFNHRKSFSATSKEDLIQELQQFSESGNGGQVKFDQDNPAKVVFVFSGQGAQWTEMGIDLAAKEPVFKESLEECNTALSKYVDWDVFDELKKPDDQTRLGEGNVMQPLLMAMGVALARWWMSKGIHPETVIGHSMGEIAAAHIGGHISLDEAAKIVTSRSSLMENEAGKGVMGATDLSLEEAEKHIASYDGKLTIAVQNSPSLTVIGGDPEAMKQLFAQLEAEGRFCRYVKMTVAAHTAQMDPVLEPLKNSLADLNPQNGAIEFHSACLNKSMKGADLSPDYWVKNVRSTVQFGSAIQDICKSESVLFIEIGPHPVLSSSIDENIQAVQNVEHTVVVSSLYRKKSETKTLYSNLGLAYDAGYDVDWTKVFHPPTQFVQLPNYAWQKEHYWFDEEPEFKSKKPKASSGSEKGSYYEYDWVDTSGLIIDDSLKNCLMVSANAGSASSVSKLLSDRGISATTVDVSSVKSSLDAANTDQILFLSPEVNGNSDLEATMQGSCLALQQVVKQVYDASPNPLPQIKVITTNAFPRDGQSINTAGALLWGMLRTLRNEHPELGFISIDSSEFSNPKMLDALLSEDKNCKEYIVDEDSIRKPILKKSTPELSSEKTIDSSSCFLITGGNSGLGLEYAKWLAGIGVSKIALASRSGAKEGTDQAIEEMKTQGADARLFSGDVTDESSLQSLVKAVEEEFGSITGVIHAAGVLDDGIALNLSNEQFIKVARPKVVGLQNLDTVLSKNKLTHFIAFSSAANILGTSAQANYNAANYYTDQFMLARHESGLAATTVDWGNIGGVGMAAKQANRGERLNDMGLSPILPEDFKPYFNSVFQSVNCQIIPLNLDMDKWAEANPSARKDDTFSHLLSAGNANNDTAQFGGSIASSTRKLKELIKSNLSAITKIPTGKLKEEDTFKSMGVDSMMALAAEE